MGGEAAIVEEMREEPERAARTSGESGAIGEAAYVRRVLITLGLVALALFLWEVRHALLLTFTAGVLAVLIGAAVGPIHRTTGLARPHAVALVVVSVLALLVLVGSLVGTQVGVQVRALATAVPERLDAIGQRYGLDLAHAGNSQSGGLGQIYETVVGPMTTFGLGAATAMTEAVLVLIGAAYLAIAPEVYVSGAVKLFPKAQQERAAATILTCGNALRLWALAQGIAMVLIGIMAGFGAWAIGLPAPIAIGLFAGLTEFVPVLGPIAGAVPPLLLALGQGLEPAAWTLALFVAIQQVESNVITPLLQKRMVSIPPALQLFAVIAFGLVFGTLGLLVAAPLTVVVYVAVQKLYVRETLGVPVVVAGQEGEGQKGTDGEEPDADRAGQAPAPRGEQG